MIGLIGYTGLIGSHLCTYYKFDKLYNSKNLHEISGNEFDRLYLACMPATKWYANLNPTQDTDNMYAIINALYNVKAKHVILISTIDVYDDTIKGDESTEIMGITHTYGKNRFLFEEFMKSRFYCTIVRLPALFGRGLKKNVLFDVLNGATEADNGFFQWYNLEWLKDDIEDTIDRNIQLRNLVTPPLQLSHFFPHIKWLKSTTKYNITTLYPSHSLIDIIHGLNQFINKPILPRLAVSNLCCPDILHEQYQQILKLYGIQYEEIAPTKIAKWGTPFKYNGLPIYSFQSIAYQITDGLTEHIKKVIDMARTHNVKVLVFGCPKQRYEGMETMFEELAAYIGDDDITICIENNSRYYGSTMLRTMAEVREFVGKINHPKIKMMLDVGNCIMENDDIHTDDVHHIHISNPFMFPLNDIYGQHLEAINPEYKGVYTLEYAATNLDELRISLNNFVDLFHK
jgi:hypothetical protein